MINPDEYLKNIPSGLRTLLLEEFNHILGSFLERKWRPSELSGGRFCEIVYSIIKGYPANYPASPSKPRDFVKACRSIESCSNLPRSFQILIPRLLPALYEIRNSRNVGHVGGDVDPSFMDSSAVVSISSWIMAELVRVFHGISTEEAQQVVDQLVEYRHPVVWSSGDVRRVLRTGLSLKNRILILLGHGSGKASIKDLISWTEVRNRSYFKNQIKALHNARFIEYDERAENVEILPPGYKQLIKLMADLED